MCAAKKQTPLMQQFHAIKKEYPDALLLFQVGDFYELFFDDAQKAAAFLGITLTTRGKHLNEPIPLCGVPVHALDHYLVKLVKGGFKVAICDQLEAATPGKVVERGVTRVLTPGTLTDTTLLDEKSASYLFSFFPCTQGWGLVFGELLTAQLFATVLPKNAERVLDAELIRFFPDEVLVPGSAKNFKPYFKKLGYFTTLVDNTDEQQADAWLHKQFNQQSVDTIIQSAELKSSCVTLHSYLAKHQVQALDQFKQIHFYEPDDFLQLDPATQKNLELVKNSNTGTRAHTLFATLDRATTAMGSRMVKKWLLRPLVKHQAIEQRLDVVQHAVRDVTTTHQLKELLAGIGDLERIIGRIALCRAPFNDYVGLLRALEKLPQLRMLLAQKCSAQLAQVIAVSLGEFNNLHKLLVAALNTDSTKNWLIKHGFDKELDRVRELVDNASGKIIELEQREQKTTNINSLKIRYNRVHGYYIEVTKANVHLVPEQYVRRQTLAGKERYTTPELQNLEHEIMRARTEIEQLETRVFDNVKTQVREYISGLRKSAHALAHLDALLSLATVAYDHGYVRPTFNQERTITIEQGRHPVVESSLGAHFIPNNTTIDDEQSLCIITGPNMGGKSTYLRQVALISLMAQLGSFVPANSANVALLDRIFTRIGAGDNLAGGKSTFLVEMEETAAICTQATHNSLVILDEVGRGTSTFDGLAIAQAVVEYIYTHIKARCLFATHYHELTQLESTHPGIVSFYAASKKTATGIEFLYKMTRGMADGSFGVEVAKCAQLPQPIINRAQTILHQLHAQESSKVTIQPATVEQTQLENKVYELEQQLAQQHKKLEQLQMLDYDNLSPKKAFDLLWNLKE